MDEWLLLGSAHVGGINNVIRENARQRVRLIERQNDVKAAIRAAEDEMRMLEGDVRLARHNAS
jgi:hypothetical protein